MKKIIISFLMLAVSAAMFSQQTKNVKPQLTKTNYLQVSKKQKTIGWILFGGTVVYFSSTYIAKSELFFIYPLVSGSMAIASIPFFNAAVRNKRKAMSLSFKNEKVPQFMSGSFVNRPVSSLSLKINL